MNELSFVEEIVLTPEQLATRWGYNYRSVLNHIRDGNIPAFQLGRSWRINLSWVQKMEQRGIPKLKDL